MKMSDKQGAPFDAWEKKMFSIPSTHIFSEYFSSYSPVGFDLTLFLFWFKGWVGGGPAGLFIYLSQKAFKAWIRSWFLDLYTHSCMSGSCSDLLGGKSSVKVKRDVWWTHRTSGVLTQTSVSKLGSAASTWWKELLGKSFSHLTLHLGLWPLPCFCHEKGMHAFILKY